MPRWTKAQQVELTGEYKRIGFQVGEHWPYPNAPELSPEELFALLREIPDGGGRAAYIAALERRAHDQRHIR
jgi:hypothetical protein